MAERANNSWWSVLTLATNPRLRMLALAATTAITIFLLWHSNEPATNRYNDAEQLRGETEPDSFVVNGDYTSYDETGQRKIVFTSPRIEQFEDDDLATMVSPSAKLFSKTDNEPWVLDAQKGSLRQSDDTLQLSGNVRVVRTIDGREATLETDSLTLDNNKSTVFTDDPVTITDRVGTTRATGMKAWIDERILELNSQVKGRYETVK